METAYSEVRKLLDQIRVLTNNPTIERVSDRIEVICRAHLYEPEEFLPDIHFTPAERRMLDLMRSRLGKTVNRDALLDAIEVMGHDQPNPKTLDVLVCRIRAKLRRYSTKYYIETDHSVGFRLQAGERQFAAGKGPSKFMMESRAA